MPDVPHYTVKVARELAKLLRRLPRDVQRRLVVAIDDLAINPRPRGCVQLKGQEQIFYRIRVGDWRIIYTVEDDILVVLDCRTGTARARLPRLLDNSS
jgi:mRNA interferase RelE/StbE